MVADAVAFAQGKQCVIGSIVDPEELKAAYVDLVTCGPMLEYVCAMSGDEHAYSTGSNLCCFTLFNIG